MSSVASNPDGAELARAVIAINQKIAAAAPPEELLDVLIGGAVRLTGAASGCVLVTDPDGLSVKSVARRGYPPDHPESSLVEDLTAPVKEALTSGRTVIEASPVPREPGATDTVLALPVSTFGIVLGAVVLVKSGRETFSETEALAAETFASLAAVGLGHSVHHEDMLEKRSLDEQLRIAREVQLSLQPKQAPAIEGFDLYGINVPSQAIGGDYFDFIPIVEGHLGIVIADVVGKSIPASLTMAGFRAFLRAEIRNNYAIRTIFAKVNNLLKEGLAPNQFVSAFYGVLDVGRRRFTYSNAGHNPPILLRAGNKRRLLVSGGPVLGILEGSAYRERFIDLVPGDVLVLYTDGVVEAEDSEGEMFGLERLQELARANSALGAQAICEAVYEGIFLFAQNPDLADDTTVVVLKSL